MSVSSFFILYLVQFVLFCIFFWGFITNWLMKLLANPCLCYVLDLLFKNPSYTLLAKLIQYMYMDRPTLIVYLIYKVNGSCWYYTVCFRLVPRLHLTLWVCAVPAPWTSFICKFSLLTVMECWGCYLLLLSFPLFISTSAEFARLLSKKWSVGNKVRDISYIRKSLSVREKD